MVQKVQKIVKAPQIQIVDKIVDVPNRIKVQEVAVFWNFMLLGPLLAVWEVSCSWVSRAWHARGIK